MVDSPVGSGVSNFHLYFMFGAMVAVIYGVFWYTVYVFAYLGRPGMLTPIVGVAVPSSIPSFSLELHSLIGDLATLLGVPQEQFWAVPKQMDADRVLASDTTIMDPRLTRHCTGRPIVGYR